MVSSVNFHTNATRIGWHLWGIDLRFAPGLPPGWNTILNPTPANNQTLHPKPGAGRGRERLWEGCNGSWILKLRADLRYGLGDRMDNSALKTRSSKTLPLDPAREAPRGNWVSKQTFKKRGLGSLQEERLNL